MEFLDNCPKCGKHLELQQINFTTAIFMCLDVKCPYPLHGDCMVVRRNIENINKPVDLFKQLKKQDMLQDSLKTTENVEQFSQSSLMLDLEELLSSHTNSHFINNIQDTAKKEDISEIPVDNIKTEIQPQNTQSLELPELDEFIANLVA